MAAIWDSTALASVIQCLSPASIPLLRSPSPENILRYMSKTTVCIGFLGSPFAHFPHCTVLLLFPRSTQTHPAQLYSTLCFSCPLKLQPVTCTVPGSVLVLLYLSHVPHNGHAFLLETVPLPASCHHSLLVFLLPSGWFLPVSLVVAPLPSL